MSQSKEVNNNNKNFDPSRRAFLRRAAAGVVALGLVGCNVDQLISAAETLASEQGKTPATATLGVTGTETPTTTPEATATQEVTSTQEATATAEITEVKRDANGNILPNPVGEWTKLPEGENQRILIGPEGSNIVLELDSRLGFSEFMFNKGKDEYFIKDGKTPQDRIYEAVNGSLYYYWCSTQGGGCASEPADMKGVDIDFWSYRNQESRGNIRIENGVTFKIMPMWDKSGGQGNWVKLIDSSKTYNTGASGSNTMWFEVDNGQLIIYQGIENPEEIRSSDVPGIAIGGFTSGLLAFLSVGKNLHDSSPFSVGDLVTSDVGEKYFPDIFPWINVRKIDDYGVFDLFRDGNHDDYFNANNLVFLCRWK